MARPLLFAVFAMSFLYVLLCLHLPVVLYADMLDDDALFTTHAASIYTGHWLGPYDLRTLVKGPGYPLFLALNAALGLPITFSQALLYATACGLLVRSLCRLGWSPALAVSLLAVILFHPSVFPVQIIRDDISPAQVLLIMVCMLESLFLQAGLPGRLVWAAAAGFCFGWFWLTREDALWIVPALAVLCAGRLWQCRRRAAPLLASFAVFALATASGWLAVATINRACYGSFTEVDFDTGAFAQAVQALQRVRVGPAQAYVPVPKKVRVAIYAASPAFASLAPYLEGPGQGWTQFGCEQMPSTCGDIAGGWFAFALRSAVLVTGHYTSPRDATRFYRQLAREVDAACGTGRLHCAKPSVRLLPAITPAQLQGIPRDFYHAWELLTLRVVLTTPDISRGSPAQLAVMDNILGRPLRVPAAYETGAVTLTGWFYAPDHSWIVVSCNAAGGTVLLPVQRYSSQDIAAAFKDTLADQVRFMLALPSANSCGLQPSESTTNPTVISFRNAKSGPVAFPGGEFYLDSVQRSDPVVTGAVAQTILQALYRLYGIVLPGATVSAMAAFLWYCLLQIRRRRLDNMIIIVGAFWVLVLARACVLVLVTVSAFPAIIQRYMLPAYPMLCIAIALSITILFQKRRTTGAF